MRCITRALEPGYDNLQFCLFFKLVKVLRRTPSKGAKGWRATAAILDFGTMPSLVVETSGRKCTDDAQSITARLGNTLNRNSNWFNSTQFNCEEYWFSAMTTHNSCRGTIQLWVIKKDEDNNSRD